MHKMFRFLFWSALIVGGLIGLLRLTALRWWRVPLDDRYLAASVSPSVSGGDLILLWRLTTPGFRDLVMCPEPGHPERVVIGRLVGQERDELEVVGADIIINGRRQAVEGNCAQRKFTERDPETGDLVEQFCSIEELEGRTSFRGEQAASFHRPANVKTTVPNGMVWLVSDNRLFPYDSRDFGPVPRKTCTESVFFRLVGAAGFFDASRRNQYIR